MKCQQANNQAQRVPRIPQYLPFVLDRAVDLSSKIVIESNVIKKKKNREYKHSFSAKTASSKGSKNIEVFKMQTAF